MNVLCHPAFAGDMTVWLRVMYKDPYDQTNSATVVVAEYDYAANLEFNCCYHRPVAHVRFVNRGLLSDFTKIRPGVEYKVTLGSEADGMYRRHFYYNVLKIHSAKEIKNV